MSDAEPFLPQMLPLGLNPGHTVRLVPKSAQTSPLPTPLSGERTRACLCPSGAPAPTASSAGGDKGLVALGGSCRVVWTCCEPSSNAT